MSASSKVVVSTFDYVLRTAVDWLVRRRTPAVLLIRTGASLAIASIGGGWAINIAIYDRTSSFLLGVDTAGGLSLLTYLQLLVGVVGLGSIGVGIQWERTRQRREAERLARRKVIVIEQRGLRSSAEAPLVDAVPTSIEGTRDPLLVDIRERIRDGVVTAPDAALERVVTIRRDLETRLSGRDRSDLDIIYGGLLPVPFTFLTGMLLDDEGRITVFDWDRGPETWRSLDGVDDGERFNTPVLPSPLGSEVVLVLSVSYRADLPAIERTFPGVPVVHLHLPTLSSDNHWSAQKQQALAQSFFETVKALGAGGVHHIRLVIAAQNSVVFRLGRIYDKRNLPDATVYQYERSSNPPYPWGVRLPTHGVERAKVIPACTGP